MRDLEITNPILKQNLKIANAVLKQIANEVISTILTR